MGKTIAEKILARKSGKDSIKPGEYIIAKPDKVMVIAERIGQLTGDIPSRWDDDIKLDRVFDPEKIVVIPEHIIPPDNSKVATEYKEARKGSKKLGIKNFFDIGRGGICHQVFVENGFAVPGELVVGSDSHTCTYGALNVAARGINYELPYILKFGEIWFRVPESIKINIKGSLQEGVYAKDIILHLTGKYGTDFALYKSIEFVGPTVEELSIPGRLTIANMGIETGAKFAIFPADEKTKEYLAKRGITDYNSAEADPDAHYEKEYNLDVTKIEPHVACPHDLSNSKPINEIEGIKIDQAFLGSCTNARYEDLEIAAQILKGEKIASNVRMIVTPASEKIYEKALENGLIKIFHDANAIITNSTCGACAGLHLGLLGDGEVCIGTQNRNFKGRMGGEGSEIYLGSPATVAASAIKGEITDPRKYL